MNPPRHAVLVVAACLAPLLAPFVAESQVRDAAYLTPAPNLHVDGIPPIPMSLVSEVRRYTESRSASLGSWHPAAREMLITTRFGNTAQAHHVAQPGGARRQLTFLDERVLGASYQPTTGEYFVFRSDRGGDEFYQIYRYDLGDGRITLLSDGGRTQNSAIRWNTAGTLVAYSSTLRNGTDRDLYTLDPRDPSSRRLLLEVSGSWSAQDWSPDDGWILASQYRAITDSDLWLVNVATGAKRPLSDLDSPAGIGGASFSADGRGVYLTTDRDSEFLELRFLDLATMRMKSLTADIDWDVEAFAPSPDGRRVAFVVNEAGFSRLYIANADGDGRNAVPGLPPGVISNLQWHPSGAELGFNVQSARSPTDVYSVDAATLGLTRWTESEMGGLTAAELSEPRSISWTSFDGLEITGIYYPPPSRHPEPWPVVINIHGGPESQARPTYLGRSNYLLNEEGVAIIFPNVRGSTGYGRTFVGLDNGMKREDSVRDIGALLDWIDRQPELDGSRVMVTGASYGGYMTLASAFHFDDRLCCSLNVVGISHFGTFLRNTESYRRDLRRQEYGDEREPEMQAFFERISPLNHTERITKPLFVVQGGNDPRVPRSESEQLVAAVKRNGGAVWYLMADDEGHGFAKKDNQDFQFYATVMFVRENLVRPRTSGDAGGAVEHTQGGREDM